ncbi:hypothetical protein quinque_012476 [Culex quinquefasciatus]
MVKRGFLAGKSTGMILLDVEKAYDSVWQDAVVYKLFRSNLQPFLVKIVESFLTNRSFTVTAVEARERKADAKKVASEKASKAAEDALWQDDDKQLAKKRNKRLVLWGDFVEGKNFLNFVQFKEEEERKKLEQARKKAEAKELLEKEMSSIKVAPKVSVQKVTRSQIEAEVEKRNRAIESVNNPPKVVPAKVVPLEENFNRVMADTEVAQTIDQALAVLAVKDGGDDKHPEKRMKAAYKAFEEEQLAILKQEHPSLKLSQLKQMIFKDWQKSPQNPLNQAKA